MNFTQKIIDVMAESLTVTIAWHMSQFNQGYAAAKKYAVVKTVAGSKIWEVVDENFKVVQEKLVADNYEELRKLAESQQCHLKFFVMQNVNPVYCLQVPLAEGLKEFVGIDAANVREWLQAGKP
jgi:hypothetical protein